MTAKHTPGPWKMVEDRGMFSESIRIRSEDKTVVVVAADDTMEIEDGAIAEVVSAEARANATLIAAAPALADALHALVNLAATTPRLNEAVHTEARHINRALLDIAGIGAAVLRAAGRLP